MSNYKKAMFSVWNRIFTERAIQNLSSGERKLSFRLKNISWASDKPKKFSKSRLLIYRIFEAKGLGLHWNLEFRNNERQNRRNKKEKMPSQGTLLYKENSLCISELPKCHRSRSKRKGWWPRSLAWSLGQTTYGRFDDRLVNGVFKNTAGNNPRSKLLSRPKRFQLSDGVRSNKNRKICAVIVHISVDNKWSNSSRIGPN